MADNEYDSPRVRRCVYGSCGRAAEPDAPWGMGFCEHHLEKAEAEIERQSRDPNRRKAVDWLTQRDPNVLNVCKCGRAYTEENPPTNGRQCRLCSREAQARYRERRRQERRIAAEKAEQARIKKAEQLRIEKEEREQRKLAERIENGESCTNGHRWYSLVAVYEFAKLGCAACDTEFMRRQTHQLEAISA